MEITVIDDEDFVGWWNGLWTIGEIYMKDVRSMVNNVLKESQYCKITRLVIVDHGTRGEKRPGVIQIGSDKVTVKNFNKYSNELGRLSHKFDANGIVHFANCWAGRHTRLLARFSETFKVPVVAGDNLDANWAEYNFGTYVRVEPDGKVKKNIERRPVTPKATDHLFD